MVNSLSSSDQSSNVTLLQDLLKTQKSQEMFAKLSKEAGGDGTTITKDQLQDLIDKKKEAGEKTGFLEDMMANFDKISTSKDSSGNATITSSDLDAAMKNGTMKKPSGPPPKEGASGSESSSKSGSSSSASSSSSSTSSTSDELTTDDLKTYYSKLQQMGQGNSAIAAKIINAINSGDTSSLTASSIDAAIADLKKQPQDVDTITPDQLTPPIDLRV